MQSTRVILLGEVLDANGFIRTSFGHSAPSWVRVNGGQEACVSHRLGDAEWSVAIYDGDDVQASEGCDSEEAVIAWVGAMWCEA